MADLTPESPTYELIAEVADLIIAHQHEAPFEIARSILGQQAARLNALQETLGKIRVHPDETGQGRVRVTHPDDGRYWVKEIAFPEGQAVTLAEIVAEFEASNHLPRKADRG